MSRELMTLMKYHTEAGSERRWKPYNGGTAGAWSNGGYQRVLLGHLSVRIMNSVYPENKSPVRYLSVTLLCRRHLRDIFPSVFSVFPCALLCSRIISSLHISEEPNFVLVTYYKLFLRPVCSNRAGSSTYKRI